MALTLPPDFLSQDEDSWRTAAQKALKGAPFERLTGRTDDGLAVEPIYRGRRDVQSRKGRPAGRPWTVCQRVDLPEPAESNRQILDDLDGGAGSLELVFATSTLTSDGTGIHIDTLADMERLLDGVYADLIQLRINGGYESPALVALLMTALKEAGVDPAVLAVNVGYDPLGWLASHGRMRAFDDVQIMRALDGAYALEDMGCTARMFEADGRIWHKGGASQAQELACAMAAAIEYLRIPDSVARVPEKWHERIGFALTAEADQLGTIAKARAARRLWASILDACGLPQAPMFLHMQTSFRMLTAKDPWVNLLRNTVAAFSAGIGGADSIAVLPHTSAAGLPDAFARRLARNTQSILLEESNLYRVADPAAGSGAIESRTERLIGAAWKMLQEIEAAGGLCKALQAGIVQSQIKASREQRMLDVARRKRSLTGVSEFPDLMEKPVKVLGTIPDDIEGLLDQLHLPDAGTKGQRFHARMDAFRTGAKIGQVIRSTHQDDPNVTCETLVFERLSERYETIRDQVEALPRRGATVFLACLGSLADYTARATWVANAFAAGGFDTLLVETTSEPQSLAAEFQRSEARVACLVSSDAVYEQHAVTAAAALRAAGADCIYMAGRPGVAETADKQADIDKHIYMGCNLLELLQELAVLSGAAEQGRQTA